MQCVSCGSAGMIQASSVVTPLCWLFVLFVLFTYFFLAEVKRQNVRSLFLSAKKKFFRQADSLALRNMPDSC